MFKAQILRRSFSLFRGVSTSSIVRSAARDGLDTIHIQRVRFKKPFFSRRRLIATAIYTAASYGALRWLDDEDEEEEMEESQPNAQEWRARRQQTSKTAEEQEDEEAEDDDVEDGDEEEVEREEEDEVSLLFLPTGFARKKQRAYYKGSDPEWEMFLSVSRDQQRLAMIRQELIDITREHMSKNRLWMPHLGPVNLKEGDAFIDFIFPAGPPIEYERPGLEVVATDEEIFIRSTTRPVSEMNHLRLNRYIYPSAVAESVFAESKVKLSQRWSGFKSYIGWDDKKQPKQTTPILNSPLKPVQRPTPSDSSHAAQKPTPSQSAPSSSNADPTHPSSSTTSQPSSKLPKPSTTPSAADNAAAERLGFVPLKPPILTLELSTFHRTLRHKWKPLIPEPYRGTFILSGVIRVVGSKGIMSVDVTAVYDPKAGQFVIWKGRVRNVRPRRQSPRGGP